MKSAPGELREKACTFLGPLAFAEAPGQNKRFMCPVVIDPLYNHREMNNFSEANARPSSRNVQGLTQGKLHSVCQFCKGPAPLVRISCICLAYALQNALCSLKLLHLEVQ